MSEQRSVEVRRYTKIVDAYDRATTRWRARGGKIIKRYADERSDTQAGHRRYNVLWSNVETLKPFLFSSTPKPVVERRYKDPDPIARLACEVVERGLAYSMQEAHFGTTLRNARDDYLLPGRGTGWVRYVPHMSPVQVRDQAGVDAATANTDGNEKPTPEEVVTFEQVIADYVHWRDFGHSVARVWEEVDCVWRWVFMDRQALVKRFGEDIGNKVPLDWSAEQQRNFSSSQDADAVDEDRAAICELWCKSKKIAVWFSKSFPELLDSKPDPLGLDAFFPCPRPIYATLTTDSLIPIPDYAEYQDQAEELDDLTARIGALTKAIKAVGVYDASVPALQQILQDGTDNTLIAVENWATLSEKGGLAGAVELLPMKEIAETLLSLYEAREKVKADLYEITGMSDIIRGNTAPDETATAQKIKSNFATKRLAERQAEVARFAGNLVHIMGNIIARLFDPETLVVMTGIKLLTAAEKQTFGQALQAAQQPPAPGMPPAPAPQPPAPPRGMTMDEVQDALKLPSWDEVFALLRNDPERRFRMDIETDTLVSADDAAEQQETVQFFEAVGGYIQQAVQAAEQQPLLAPLLAKMLLFGVRRFRIARDLESAFEDAVDKLEQQASQPQPPKPDPAMAKVQGELELQKARQQGEMQLARLKLQSEHAQNMQDMGHRHGMESRAADTQSASEAASQQFEAFKFQMQQQSEAHQARLDAALSIQAERFKAHTAELIAHIQNLGKIEVARITADAAADADAEQHEEEAGA